MAATVTVEDIVAQYGTASMFARTTHPYPYAIGSKDAMRRQAADVMAATIGGARGVIEIRTRIQPNHWNEIDWRRY